MSFIEWDEKYSVQVKEIDEQHQKLIGLINTLHDAMRDGKGRDVISGIIGDKPFPLLRPISSTNVNELN